MLSKGKGLVAIVLGVALLAGHVMAQAPDFEGRERRPAARAEGGRRAEGDQARQARAAQMRNLWAVTAIFGLEGAQVANTEKGIDVTLTAANPEAVAQLQKDVTDRLARFQDALAQMKEAAGAERLQRFARRQGILGLLATGDVTVATANIENGIVVSFSSEKPEVAKQLQDGAQQWLEQARQRAQRMAVGQRMREARELLQNEALKIEAADVEGGITITVTAADPELQAKIKDLLKDYLQGLREQYARMQQMRDQAGRRPEGDAAAEGRRRRLGGQEGEGRRRDRGEGAAEGRRRRGNRDG